MKEDHVVEDHVKEDCVNEDHVKKDHVKEDHVKEDYVQEEDHGWFEWVSEPCCRVAESRLHAESPGVFRCSTSDASMTPWAEGEGGGGEGGGDAWCSTLLRRRRRRRGLGKRRGESCSPPHLAHHTGAPAPLLCYGMAQDRLDVILQVKTPSIWLLHTFLEHLKINLPCPCHQFWYDVVDAFNPVTTTPLFS